MDLTTLAASMMLGKKYADSAVSAGVNAVAKVYDATSTYSVGDCVVYSDKLYRCTTAIATPEAWNASHWTEI